MIEPNGVAHTILTVTSFRTALPFYEPLMAFLKMDKVFQSDSFHYWVGGRTAIGIQEEHAEHAGGRFIQFRVGLHHLALRARSREDIDALGAYLQQAGATIVRGPEKGDWAPGYYYVLFEDPDGIRLEMCFVPGKGVLDEKTEFDGSSGFGEVT